VTYDPPRQKTPTNTADPLEIELAIGVRPCGSCTFFWPQDEKSQTYGPYTAFDFDTNFPQIPDSLGDKPTFKIADITTRTARFPDPAVLGGCRKAPIMTVGINPNLTPFTPGLLNSTWAYPSFRDTPPFDGTAKFAYYYRHRTVFQESCDEAFVRTNLFAGDLIKASQAGTLVDARRKDESPSYEIGVRYDGAATAVTLNLASKTGEPSYSVLVGSDHRFKAGDVIAARISVAPNQHAALNAQRVGYYQRMRPVLDTFQANMKVKGADLALQIGEDLCQLDMVACASPHWGADWLGGTAEGVRSIVSKCVSENSWALKQIVQTRPAIIIFAGEASFNMFRSAFGAFIASSAGPLPLNTEDGAFTLLRMTCNSASPYSFNFSTVINGAPYSLEFRIVVSPHFSYSTNFPPQFRLSPNARAALKATAPDCVTFLQSDPRIDVQSYGTTEYAAYLISRDTADVISEIQAQWPAAAADLLANFYSPVEMLAGVLGEMYEAGKLRKKSAGDKGLERSEGSCAFCVNPHWTFPEGCQYGKNLEAPTPPVLLKRVVAEIVANGRPAPAFMPPESRFLDSAFETRRPVSIAMEAHFERVLHVNALQRNQLT
jgi:hypothetical protein